MAAGFDVSAETGPNTEIYVNVDSSPRSFPVGLLIVFVPIFSALAVDLRYSG